VVGDQPVVMAGGDYYDLFRPDERTLIVLIGDASGHGLKACMAIMAMHTLIRMMTGDHFRDTAAFVGEINQRLCENSIVQSGGGFITLFYAAIDTVAHTMNWTSAGHPLALLHRFATNEVVTVGSDSDTGLPLGIVPDVAYSANTLELPPASEVLLYSDGLTDAFPLDRPGHAQFGVRGIVETLRTCERAGPENTVAQLFRASMEHAGGQGRHDDTSLVLLERLATDETGPP
jgi:serine phosphatase RsbU (regulator of sigma subunit)